MMRRWAVLGACAGMAGAVVVHAPAVWWSVLLSDATGARVQLLETRGSLWNGDGRLRIGRAAQDADARILPGRVSWSWGWDAGAPRVVLRADCCTPQPVSLRWEIGWGRLTAHLSDGPSQWPAGLMAAWGAPWNTVQPEGELRLQTRGMSVEWSGAGTRVRGELQAEALAVGSRLSTLRPVGSYRLTLSAQGADAAPTLQLKTLEGPLQLTGSGQWTGAAWRFRGDAVADPASEAVLDSLLNLLGQRQGNKSVLSWG